MHLHHSPPPPPTIALGTPLGKLPTAQRPLAQHVAPGALCTVAQPTARYRFWLQCWLVLFGRHRDLECGARGGHATCKKQQRHKQRLDRHRDLKLRAHSSHGHAVADSLDVITGELHHAGCLGYGARRDSNASAPHILLCLIIGSHTRTAGRRKRSDAGMNGGTEA